MHKAGKGCSSRNNKQAGYDWRLFRIVAYSLCKYVSRSVQTKSTICNPGKGEKGPPGGISTIC